MKKLDSFRTKMEAHLATQFLEENGIHCEIRGSKEYSSHVLGGDSGTYDLLVNQDDFEAAQAFLKETKTVKLQLQELGLDKPAAYFKKAVMLAVFGAVVVPIVFNFYSLRNLALYQKTETRSGRQFFGSLFILLAQIPALIFVYFVIKTYF